MAESLLRYVDIGVTTILLRGFDPMEDARDYADIIRLVRGEVARREDQDSPDSLTIGR